MLTQVTISPEVDAKLSANALAVFQALPEKALIASSIELNGLHIDFYLFYNKYNSNSKFYITPLPILRKLAIYGNTSMKVYHFLNTNRKLCKKWTELAYEVIPLIKSPNTALYLRTPSNWQANVTMIDEDGIIQLLHKKANHCAIVLKEFFARIKSHISNSAADDITSAAIDLSIANSGQELKKNTASKKSEKITEAVPSTSTAAINAITDKTIKCVDPSTATTATTATTAVDVIKDVSVVEKTVTVADSIQKKNAVANTTTTIVDPVKNITVAEKNVATDKTSASLSQDKTLHNDNLQRKIEMLLCKQEIEMLEIQLKLKNVEAEKLAMEVSVAKANASEANARLEMCKRVAEVEKREANLEAHELKIAHKRCANVLLDIEDRVVPNLKDPLKTNYIVLYSYVWQDRTHAIIMRAQLQHIRAREKRIEQYQSPLSLKKRKIEPKNAWEHTAKEIWRRKVGNSITVWNKIQEKFPFTFYGMKFRSGTRTDVTFLTREELGSKYQEDLAKNLPTIKHLNLDSLEKVLTLCYTDNANTETCLIEMFESVLKEFRASWNE